MNVGRNDDQDLKEFVAFLDEVASARASCGDSYFNVGQLLASTRRVGKQGATAFAALEALEETAADDAARLRTAREEAEVAKNQAGNDKKAAARVSRAESLKNDAERLHRVVEKTVRILSDTSHSGTVSDESKKTAAVLNACVVLAEMKTKMQARASGSQEERLHYQNYVRAAEYFADISRTFAPLMQVLQKPEMKEMLSRLLEPSFADQLKALFVKERLGLTDARRNKLNKDKFRATLTHQEIFRLLGYLLLNENAAGFSDRAEKAAVLKTMRGIIQSASAEVVTSLKAAGRPITLHLLPQVTLPDFVMFSGKKNK